MNKNTFAKLFNDAKNYDSYWVEDAILSFTKDLVKMMKSNNMSNSDLASSINSSRAYITKVLRGNANFTIETMVKLSRATGGKLNIKISDKRATTHWFEAFDGNGTRIHFKDTQNKTSSAVTVSKHKRLAWDSIKRSKISVDEYAAAK